MSNMSYCRFHNTAMDLQDCVDAIENGDTEDMSRYEINGLKNILQLAEWITEKNDEIEEIINDYEFNLYK